MVLWEFGILSEAFGFGWVDDQGKLLHLHSWLLNRYALHLKFTSSKCLRILQQMAPSAASLDRITQTIAHKTCASTCRVR